MSDNTMGAVMERSLDGPYSPPFTQLDPTPALEETGDKGHSDISESTWDFVDLSYSDVNYPTPSTLENHYLDPSNIHGPTGSMDSYSHMSNNDSSLMIQHAEEDLQLYDHDVSHQTVDANIQAEFPPSFHPFEPPSVSMIGIGAWSHSYDYTVEDPVRGTEGIEWHQSRQYFQSGQINAQAQVQNTPDEEADLLSNSDVFQSGPVSDAGITETPCSAGEDNPRYLSRRDSSPWSAVRAVSRSAKQISNPRQRLR